MEATTDTSRVPHILLAVTGSIAAFKALSLTSDLVHRGYDVRVMLTQSAQQFVTPLSFEALAHTAVRTDMFPEHEYSQSVDADGQPHVGISHIDDARWADIAVVVPASANTIAKLAHGIADNYVTSTLLAVTCPVLIAPAMNTHMYEHPATQRNLSLCQSYGMHIVEPDSGILACNEVGKGRLAAVADIEQAIEELLNTNTPNATNVLTMPNEQASTAPALTAQQQAQTLQHQSYDMPLAGKHVLITAGPTQEALDPVRYITNHSTGTMGYALAEQARDLGAEVILISGPVSISEPAGVHVIHVVSAQDMFAAVQEHYAQCDLAIMAAAVGDFRPEYVSKEKIKKHGKTTLELTLVANPDILAWAGAHKREQHPQILCGFAMETQDLIANASTKLRAKHADMIVANSLREEGAGFGTGTNIVTLLSPTASANSTLAGDGVHLTQFDRMSKPQVAQAILHELMDCYGK